MLKDVTCSFCGVAFFVSAVAWVIVWGPLGLLLVAYVKVFQGDTSVAWETYTHLLCGPIQWIGRNFYENRA